MKRILCPICMTRGEMVDMQAQREYFKCPECDNEVWPDQEGRFVKEWLSQRQYRSCSLPEGVQIHGGEKKQGKSSLNQKMRKDSLSKLNTLLYKNR